MVEVNIAVAVMIGGIIGFLLAKLFFLQSVRGHRKDAVSQSKSVTLGYVSEKIAPLLPDFPYHYKDLMFLGKGVDYIVFDGLSEGDLREIIFLEIKSGNSQLNRNEKMIKHVIQRGAVSYETLRLR